jgi:hypothetical protein
MTDVIRVAVEHFLWSVGGYLLVLFFVLGLFFIVRGMW